MSMLKIMWCVLGCLSLNLLPLHADEEQQPCCESAEELAEAQYIDEQAWIDEEEAHARPECRCYAPSPIPFLYEYDAEEKDCEYAAQSGLTGVWFPEEPVLFHPLVADPRQLTFSAGWRFDDQALAKNVIDVSYGDTVPFYEWCDVWPWHGRLRIELEGALWAVFDPLHDSSPLMNADYFGGLALSYAACRWQFRLRAYHISSHIGDEFLLNHPEFDRRNPSAEYIDFFASYDFTDDIRLYGGLGWIPAQDDSFHFSPFYAEGGFELRVYELAYIAPRNRLYLVPFYAMHLRYSSDFKHHVDATYVLGYEMGKFCGLCRKLRGFIEYHDGYSVEGQFYRRATNYLALRVSYGF